MSIRDLLARFRPSKASVEPVPRTDDLGAYLMLPTGLHRLNSPPVPIWFQDYSTIVAGKPEKLS